MQAILTVGVPGCGKSTWAQQEAEATGAVVIELDMARQAVSGDASIQANLTEVLALRDKWLFEAAVKGQNVILSDTNLNEEFRVQLQRELEALGFEVSIKIFDTPHDVSLARNGARERVVPAHAMERMISEFDRQFGQSV